MFYSYIFSGNNNKVVVNMKQRIMIKNIEQLSKYNQNILRLFLRKLNLSFEDEFMTNTGEYVKSYDPRFRK